MSNRQTVLETITVFDHTVKKRMTEPNNWMILNRNNCLDIYCKNIIYIQDREILKHYFPNSEICIWSWNNGLKLRNLIHVIHKGKRNKCKFCKQTFNADNIKEYRQHVLDKHIAKGKYGTHTELRMNITINSNIQTQVFIE